MKLSEKFSSNKFDDEYSRRLENHREKLKLHYETLLKKERLQMEIKQRSVRHQTEVILSVSTTEFEQNKIKAENNKELTLKEEEELQREKTRIAEETLWKKAQIRAKIESERRNIENRFKLDKIDRMQKLRLNFEKESSSVSRSSVLQMRNTVEADLKASYRSQRHVLATEIQKLREEQISQRKKVVSLENLKYRRIELDRLRDIGTSKKNEIEMLETRMARISRDSQEIEAEIEKLLEQTIDASNLEREVSKKTEAKRDLERDIRNVRIQMNLLRSEAVQNRRRVEDLLEIKKRVAEMCSMKVS